MPSEALYFGATIVGAKDGSTFFGPIKVPGTMSKQATIDNHIAKVRGEREEHMKFPPLGFAGSVVPSDDAYENHAHRPMVGVLASAVILDKDGTCVYTQVLKTGELSRARVALPLINFLREAYPRQFATSLRYGDADPDASLFGFNLKQVLRIAAAEVLHRNTQVTDAERVVVPVKLWHNPVGVYDPFDVLLPSNDQKDLDLYSLLRYYNVETTAEELATSSLRQAETVKTLVERAQLV